MNHFPIAPLPDFTTFIKNPQWISQLKHYALHISDFSDILETLFADAIQHQHYEFIITTLLIIQDATYKRKLLLNNNAANLLQAIATNDLDILNILFDSLNYDDQDNTEVEDILVNTSEKWIPSISNAKTLIPLFEFISLPTLLKVSKRLNILPVDSQKPWLYAEFSHILCANLANLLDLSQNIPQREDALLKALIDYKLQQYIHSIDNNQRRQFHFFKSRQTQNRQINYELAHHLREALLTKPTAEVFADIYAMRDKIRQSQQNPPWFNFIRSESLNEVIQLGRSGRA